MLENIKHKLKLKQLNNWLEKKSKRVVLPGLEGLTLFSLWIIFAEGILKGTFTTRASSIAFSFFMAIFPFLLFILNLIPFVWFIDDFQLKLQTFIDELLPPQTSNFFDSIFTDIANNPRGGLLSFVFVLSIILMANGINAIFTGFEDSYHTTDNRGIARQYFIAVATAIIIAFLLLLTVITTIYLTYLIERLSDLGIFKNIIWAQIGRYAVFVFMIYNAIATLYYFGTREGRDSRYFSIGALFTTFLILLMTFFFKIYITNFSRYNELYGSIGALLILMFYIWLNSNILLLGYELNASINKLKKRRNR
jgi:membrane protein